MYLIARKIHLWVGLILAVVLLVEAATGLILAEPRLFAGERLQSPAGGETRQVQGQLRLRERRRERGAQEGIVSEARRLHQGRVGSLDLRWVIELSAVGLVVLTVTGVYMAAFTLGAGRRKA